MNEPSHPRPTVGEPAPDFTLPSTAGEDVTLSAFRGRSHVILAFFPLAFTSTCTVEMEDFSRDNAEFGAAGVRIFGVSVDSVPTLKAFREKHGLAVDFLSDFKREVCRLYGTLLEDPFFASRSYFLIDRDGTLRWSHTEADLGDKRENRELLERVRDLA